MTGILLGWLIKFIMTHFLYIFGGVDKKRSTGGPLVMKPSNILQDARPVGAKFAKVQKAVTNLIWPKKRPKNGSK